MKATLLLFLLSLTILKSEEKPPPNIIYIMLDEWGCFEWSGAGHHIFDTPNIDRLAKNGMLFTQMLAGGSLCAPTRSTLMTGQHTGHTTVRANNGTEPLLEEDFTIAEMLKTANYATGGFGKWGLGDCGTSGAAELQGFDEFFGYYHQVHAHTYYPNYLIHNGKKVPLKGNTGHALKGETFSQYLIHDRAKQFITQHAGKKPFFAYLPYTIPHALYGIPEDEPAYLKYKAEGQNWDAPQHHSRADIAPPDEAERYAAFVELADRQIGEVLSLLDQTGIADNTIVFLCGDNGANEQPFHNEKYPQGFFKSNTNPITGEHFRGGKGNFYEGGLRVTYIVSWPGKIQKGTTSDHLGYFPDVMPTLAELTNTKTPEQCDGISFLPTLLGQKGQKQHEKLFWQFRKQIAVREGKWKLLHHQAKDTVELYDLSQDLGENNNIAQEHPEIVSRLIHFAKNEPTPDLIGKVFDKSLGFKGHKAK